MQKRKASRARKKTLKAWSFSTWNNYDICPAKVGFEKIQGIKMDDSSPAMERGSEIHEAVELYLKGAGDLPSECHTLEEEFAELKALKPDPEARLCIDANWVPVDWFAPNAWLRCVFDWTYWKSKTHLVIGDLKTGKIRASHEGQLNLYALAALRSFPKARTVTAELWYCDQDEIHSDVFKRSAIERLEEEWRPRWEAMLSDSDFDPAPGSLCKWCVYRRSNDGPCEHG